MLGEEYLDKRKRLDAIVEKIVTLSLRLDSPSDELKTDTIKEYLNRPFRILVCGEKEAGKTTFLSSLVGKKLDLPAEESKAIKFFGSSVLSPEKESDSLSYHRKPELGELELIDTSGVSEMNQQDIEQLKALIPTCDFVLWVVSTGNPWASKTWDLITDTRDLVNNHSAVVLQQVDQRPPEDIPILLDHLRSLSIQRVGHALTIHCVSAELAAKAWSQDSRDLKIWKDSGFDKFELTLDSQISKSCEREDALKYVYQSAKTVIDRLEDTIQNRARALQGDKRVLQAVDVEVGRSREIEVKGARENLNKLGSVVSEQVEATVKHAAQKNGVIGTMVSLFTRGDGAVIVEKRLQETVGEAALVRAREIGFSILTKCEDHWNIMRPELQRKMAVNVTHFDMLEFDSKVDDFSKKMEQSMRHSMVLLKLRRLLDRMMVARQQVLKRALVFVLALVSAAGFSGYIIDDVRHKLPFFILALAGVLVLWMLWYGKKTKDALLEDYADTVVAARLHLAEMMQPDYVDGVRDFYTAYFPMFENIRRYIAEAEANLKPQQKEWHELFLMLRAMEQEI